MRPSQNITTGDPRTSTVAIGFDPSEPPWFLMDQKQRWPWQEQKRLPNCGHSHPPGPARQPATQPGQHPEVFLPRPRPPASGLLTGLLCWLTFGKRSSLNKARDLYIPRNPPAEHFTRTCCPRGIESFCVPRVSGRWEFVAQVFAAFRPNAKRFRSCHDREYSQAGQSLQNTNPRSGKAESPSLAGPHPPAWWGSGGGQTRTRAGPRRALVS